MPLKTEIAVRHECSWNECSGAGLKALLPIGLAGLGWWCYAKNKDQQDWVNKLRVPGWVMTDPTKLFVMDLITVAPIGFAAHLICKEGRGDDRKLALGLYGAGLLTSALIGLPLFLNKKDLRVWFGTKALLAGLFGATTVAFYKVNEQAGWMVAPLAAWLTYGSIGLFATMQNNPSPN